jgi:putative FmdB family regulatory protein
MPTYDYRCNSCSHTFEEFQLFSEAPLKKCPECGKNKLQRLFGTGAAVLFKGSGFYQTDYRSDSYQSAAKADQEPAKSSSSASSEPATKPAAQKDKSSAKKTSKSGE